MAIGGAAHTAPARHRGASRYRRVIAPCGPLRVSSPRTAQGLCAFAAQAPGIVEGSLPHRPGCRRRASCARGPARRQMAANRGRPRIVPPEGPQGGGCFPRGPLRVLGPPRGFRAACAMSADRGAGCPPGGASLPGRPSFGRCAPARFCAVCAPCNQSWCFRWFSLRGGLVGGRLSFVMRRFPIRIFVGHRKRLCGL